MISQDRIVSLLGQGLSAEIVATAVGCDPSYISQILSDETVRQRVSELRIQNLQSATERDGKWDTLENRLLDKLSDSVDYIMKPREILQALAIINNAKRRGSQAQETMVVNNTVVNLTIPKRAVQQFVVNQANHVIAIDEQSLITLPSSNIRTLVPAAEQKQLSTITDETDAATFARARLRKLTGG